MERWKWWKHGVVYQIYPRSFQDNLVVRQVGLQAADSFGERKIALRCEKANGVIHRKGSQKDRRSQ